MIDAALDSEFRSMVRTEIRHEQARGRTSAAETAAARGVAWSGLGPDAWRPRSPDRLEADAACRLARLRDWRAGVHGRLLTSATRAQSAAIAAHSAGETLRAALARNPDDPVSGCAAAISTLVAESRALVQAAREARRAMRDAMDAAD